MRLKTIVCLVFFCIILASLSYASIWDILSPTGMAARITCTDSDKGDNQYDAGTLISDGKTYTDTCTEKNTKLVEYYCYSNRMKQKTYTCKLGCADGRCVNCVDSDSGISAYKIGVAYLNSAAAKKYKDTCTNVIGKTATRGAYVLEYYCKDNKVVSTSIKCNCVNGACLMPKLDIKMITPTMNSIEEAYDGELDVDVNTTINAKCELGLFKQVLSGGFVPMSQSGGTHHQYTLNNLEPDVNYILVVRCVGEDGQTLEKTTNFKVQFPIISGYFGILTDDELYSLNRSIKLI